ncbi:hypothetical protein [Corynebacterium pacaense]|uniref:hypothetical protein n=1 Tax=Corynebacterium pacaense TaxID=1816684 RepID=UPI0009BC552E|nr:hypothetical protein [Corynebacterium pacaense]
MTTGFIVDTDFTALTIEFDDSTLPRYLGGFLFDQVEVSFSEIGPVFSALFDVTAKMDGAEPNPVASLGAGNRATGNSDFFTDPTAAICGRVIFLGRDGGDIGPAQIREVERGIRTVRTYQQDSPGEFEFWRNAAINTGRLEP